MFWGFAAAKWSYTPGQFAIAARIGCGSAFPGESLPEIDLYFDSNGGCQPPMTRVDTGAPGTEILVKLAPQNPTELHSVSIQIDDGQSPVSADGGTVQYYAVINNLDDVNENSLIQWSVLTMPGEIDYSIHKSNTVVIAPGGTREYTRPR